MPADMTALAADLAAESAVTRALVAGLDEAGWHTPTPAAGWDIADQISHLAYFDEVTVQSALDPEQFKDELAEAEASGGINPDTIAAQLQGQLSRAHAQGSQARGKVLVIECYSGVFEPEIRAVVGSRQDGTEARR